MNGGTGGQYFAVSDTAGRSHFYTCGLPMGMPYFKPWSQYPNPWTTVPPDWWGVFPIEVQDAIHEILGLPPPPGLGLPVAQVEALVASYVASGNDQDPGVGNQAAAFSGDNEIPSGEYLKPAATIYGALVVFLQGTWLPAIGPSELNKAVLDAILKDLKSSLNDPAVGEWGKRYYFLAIWQTAVDDVSRARAGRKALAKRKEKMPKIEDLDCGPDQQWTGDLGGDAWGTLCCRPSCKGKSVWHTNQEGKAKTECVSCTCLELHVNAPKVNGVLYMEGLSQDFDQGGQLRGPQNEIWDYRTPAAEQGFDEGSRQPYPRALGANERLAAKEKQFPAFPGDSFRYNFECVATVEGDPEMCALKQEIIEYRAERAGKDERRVKGWHDDSPARPPAGVAPFYNKSFGLVSWIDAPGWGPKQLQGDADDLHYDAEFRIYVADSKLGQRIPFQRGQEVAGSQINSACMRTMRLTMGRHVLKLAKDADPETGDRAIQHSPDYPYPVLSVPSFSSYFQPIRGDRGWV